MEAEELIRLLNLAPLPGEGGFFRQTYLSPALVRKHDGTERHALSAIYYLITPQSFSALHRLPSDEAFHFYLGDPVEMIQLGGESTFSFLVLGQDLRASQNLQAVVPAGTWQGARLLPGGKWALLGTNVGPGFEFSDLTVATAEDIHAYQGHQEYRKICDFLAKP